MRTVNNLYTMYSYVYIKHIRHSKSKGPSVYHVKNERSATITDNS